MVRRAELLHSRQRRRSRSRITSRSAQLSFQPIGPRLRTGGDMGQRSNQTRLSTELLPPIYAGTSSASKAFRKHEVSLTPKSPLDFGHVLAAD